MIARYRDEEQNLSISPSVYFDAKNYASSIRRWEDVAYYGRAVCGFAVGGKDPVPTCVMAGKAETLRVISTSEGMSIEDIAAFTEQFYDEA